MKKILSIATFLLCPFILLAGDFRLPDGTYIAEELINIPAVLLVIYLISAFIVIIVKTFLDHRLKSKMLDKGVPEKVVEQFLQPNQVDTRTQALKWFLVLAGIAAGLALICATMPLGIHSLAILAFCLSLSFLGYFFYLRKSNF